MELWICDLLKEKKMCFKREHETENSDKRIQARKNK